MEFKELKCGSGDIVCWELITDFVVPCTEEEQSIYGVKYRKPKDKYEIIPLRMTIYEDQFEDGEIFYSAFEGCYFCGCFKKLEEAKEFLIKRYQSEQQQKQ